jgi:sulfur carrier protein ThiS
LGLPPNVGRGKCLLTPANLKKEVILKINVKFGPNFKEVFNADVKQIELENGAIFRDLLEKLCDTPARRIKLLGITDSLLPQVLVSKNGRFIVHLKWLDTDLSDGDQINIFNLFGGG